MLHSPEFASIGRGKKIRQRCLFTSQVRSFFSFSNEILLNPQDVLIKASAKIYHEADEDSIWCIPMRAKKPQQRKLGVCKWTVKPTLFVQLIILRMKSSYRDEGRTCVHVDAKRFISITSNHVGNARRSRIITVVRLTASIESSPRQKHIIDVIMRAEFSWLPISFSLSFQKCIRLVYNRSQNVNDTTWKPRRRTAHRKWELLSWATWTLASRVSWVIEFYCRRKMVGAVSWLSWQFTYTLQPAWSHRNDKFGPAQARWK